MKYFTVRQEYTIAGIAVCLLILFTAGQASRAGLCPRAPLPGSFLKVPPPFAVEIAGEVRSPGIYRFAGAPGVVEVIERAGGLRGTPVLPRAFTSAAVYNGARIVIAPEPALCALTLMHPVKRFLYFIPFDINAAGVEELVLIPGVGDTTARAIISYRERHGTFASLDTLINVPGIGRRKLEKMKTYLTL